MTKLPQLDAEVLRPGGAGYDEARTVWNAMVDRRPAAIVRCTSEDDVVAAVRTARDAGLEIGVRCGGHGVLGLAVPDGGLMIDLTPMGGVRVDPARRRARVQGGALLGALDGAAQEHGLATTAGNVSHTGVGGLTLGGGMGWLARRCGMTCDNVAAYRVVTADGSVLRATPDEHPDLFWGLRGGGGNFGIVTEFEFRLHPVGTRATVAEWGFPLDAGPAVLARWRELLASAPREATLTADVSDAGVGVGYVWVGPGADSLLPAFRALGRARSERVEEMSYLTLQTKDDTVGGHAYRRYSKGHYLRSFPDAAIEAFLLRGTPDGSGEHLPGVGLQAYGGAIADVPDEDSAFGHRDALVEFGASTRWTDPGEDETRTGGARRASAAIAPFSSGVYVNALSDDGAEGVRRAYPERKLARLAALKAAYDPGNVFHLNQNILPA